MTDILLKVTIRFDDDAGLAPTEIKDTVSRAVLDAMPDIGPQSPEVSVALMSGEVTEFRFKKQLAMAVEHFRQEVGAGWPFLTPRLQRSLVADQLLSILSGLDENTTPITVTDIRDMTVAINHLIPAI